MIMVQAPGPPPNRTTINSNAVIEWLVITTCAGTAILVIQMRACISEGESQRGTWGGADQLQLGSFHIRWKVTCSMGTLTRGFMAAASDHTYLHYT